ncbi:MAG: tetratricopeptide repeat protein [Deltaproteobacteria bacterium]|nr:tetratricopeptide repeat protein [Deltaproteobacteria bacterium]
MKTECCTLLNAQGEHRPHLSSRIALCGFLLLSLASVSLGSSTGFAQEAPEKEDIAAEGKSLDVTDADLGDEASKEGSSVKTETPEKPVAPEVTPKPKRAPNALMHDDTPQARLESLSDMVKRYEEEALDFREQLRQIAERKYKERKAKIESSYAKALAPVIDAERRHRLEAIVAFERFLERHPDNRRYTPDALFRLAELYFEKYDGEYQKKMAEYRDAFSAWSDAGGEGDPPAEPDQHFERTIALYQRLITDFPEYRFVDGAYYLLGYTLKAQGEVEESVKVWKTLVQRYPDSRFFAEVWFRVGDFYFEEEQWPEAIEAFLEVVPLKDTSYYDKGLYKLAWTYYLVNDFDKSVDRFFELLDYSYAKRAELGADEGSVLEEEAIQYVGISFSDDNWNRPSAYKKLLSGDSIEDEFADVEIDYVRFAEDLFSAKAEQEGKRKPYERDVIAKLGDILFKQSKNKAAIVALQYAISLDPLHRDAPKLQDLIVQSYERSREFDSASAARDLLVGNYSKGTDWYNKWQHDSQARNEVDTIAKVSLYKAAIYYHQQANKDYEEGREDVAVTNFAAAAKAYREYLDRYPHDKEAYELSYYLAETYFYSLDFNSAITAYENVRDSNQGTGYQAQAALNAVYSYEKVMETAIANGELAEVDLYSGEVDVAGTANDIPELRLKYIGAVDLFLKDGRAHEEAPAFAYPAAALFYKYQHFDDALKRFEEVIQRWPKHEAAKAAANFILDFYVQKKDWAKVAALSKQFEKEIAGGDEDGTFKKLGSGAEFQLAKALLEDGDKAIQEGRISEGIAKLEQGANEYLRLLEEDPKRDFADLMMYNAALSLEKARRPAKAAELYERLYREYPTSQFAAEAMFRVASKSEQAFNFEKAVETYLKLVKEYPKAEQRADAQINAALALEGQQKYDKAAKQLIRFAALFPEKEEAADVYFRAAVVYKKTKNNREEMKVLRDFIKRFGKDRKQTPKVIEAWTRIGEIQLGKSRKVKKWKPRKSLKDASRNAFQKAVSGFAGAKDSQNAAYFAGKAAFNLAEDKFVSYEKMEISGRTGQKQGKALIAKTRKLGEVAEGYKSVIKKYRQAEWSLAALFRIGALYDGLRKSMLDAPCPDDIRRIDEIACDEYKVVLEDQAFTVEEKAVEAYRVAYERALAMKLTNDWTKKTLEALNLLRPAEFSIDKEPITMPSNASHYTLGTILPDGGAPQLKSLTQEPAVGVGEEPEAAAPPTDTANETAPEGGLK